MLGFCAFSSFCFSALKIRYALRARFGCGRAPPDLSTGVCFLAGVFPGVFFGVVATVPPAASNASISALYRSLPAAASFS